jgi:plastocyanin
MKHLWFSRLSVVLGLAIGAAILARPDAPAASPEVREIAIEAKEFGFNPPQFDAEPGQKLSITLVNRGSEPHGMTFELPGGNLALSKPVAAGQRGTLKFSAPKDPGMYRFYSPVADDRTKGMEGQLIVRKAP